MSRWQAKCWVSLVPESPTRCTFPACQHSFFISIISTRQTPSSMREGGALSKAALFAVARLDLSCRKRIDLPRQKSCNRVTRFCGSAKHSSKSGASQAINLQIPSQSPFPRVDWHGCVAPPGSRPPQPQVTRRPPWRIHLHLSRSCRAPRAGPLNHL